MEPEVHIPLWLANAFGLYLFAQLVAAIWWASNISTTLTYMRESISKMESHIALTDSNYASRVDVAKDLAFRDQQLIAVWKKIDSLPCPMCLPKK